MVYEEFSTFSIDEEGISMIDDEEGDGDGAEELPEEAPEETEEDDDSDNTEKET